MIDIFLQGFLLQGSLILALGAQNLFVLNSGLRKQRHLLVAFVSSACDTLLVFIGVIGVATIFVQLPLLKVALGLIGVGFLAFYGFVKLKEAKNGINFQQDSKHVVTARQAIMTSLGFSLLNPHVYLDTVVLIGGYSSKFNFISERFAFGMGASALSTVWFFGLSVLASFVSRLLNSSKAMRIVSLLSGVILIVLAIKLSVDVLSWQHDDLALNCMSFLSSCVRKIIIKDSSD